MKLIIRIKNTHKQKALRSGSFVVIQNPETARENNKYYADNLFFLCKIRQMISFGQYSFRV
jgi:hypothetical protein